MLLCLQVLLEHRMLKAAYSNIVYNITVVFTELHI